MIRELKEDEQQPKDWVKTRRKVPKNLKTLKKVQAEREQFGGEGDESGLKVGGEPKEGGPGRCHCAHASVTEESDQGPKKGKGTKRSKSHKGKRCGKKKKRKGAHPQESKRGGKRIRVAGHKKEG